MIKRFFSYGVEFLCLLLMLVGTSLPATDLSAADRDDIAFFRTWHEEGDINEIDRHMLRSLRCPQRRQNKSGIRECTLEHVPLDFLVQRVHQETLLLKETVQESHTNVAIDERLRGQVWNLAQSIEILDGIFGDAVEPAFVDLHYRLRSQAIDALMEGIVAYEGVQQRIEILLQHRLSKQDPLLPLLGKLKTIPDYAIKFEHATNSTHGNITHEACGATARAIFYLMGQQHGIPLDNLKKSSENPIVGLNYLVETIKANRDKGAYVYLCDTDKFDHAFIIEQTDEGRYRILQSYVNRYSLKAFLAQSYVDNGAKADLSYEEIMAFLQHMRAMSKSTSLAKSDYKKLFYSPAPEYLSEYFASGDEEFIFSTLKLKGT